MKIIEYQVQRFDLLMDDYHYKVRQGTFPLKSIILTSIIS